MPSADIMRSLNNLPLPLRNFSGHGAWEMRRWAARCALCHFTSLAVFLLALLPSLSPSWGAGVEGGAPKTLANSSASPSPIPTDCNNYYAEIVPLKPPDFRQSALWKKTWGLLGIDRPRALMKVADGGIIVVGDTRPYVEKQLDTGGKSGDFQSPRSFITRYNAAGELLFDRHYDVAGLDQVTTALLKKSSIVVMSALAPLTTSPKTSGSAARSRILVEFFNGAGERKRQFILGNPDEDFIPRAMVARNNGGRKSTAANSATKDADATGFVILAQTKPRGAKSRADALPRTTLLWVSEDGRIERRRDYLPGIETDPFALTRGNSGRMVITGRIKNEHKVEAGWILSVDAQGTILFERPYTRGAGATLRAAKILPDGGIVAIGDSLPVLRADAGGNDKAANDKIAPYRDKAGWMIRTTIDGTPLWQKYLAGQYAYTGADVKVTIDGTIWGLWAANPTDFGGRKFARLLSVSPEGQLLSDYSYIEGSNSVPLYLEPGDEFMAVAGMAETGFSEKKYNDPNDPRAFVTYDNWVMALPLNPPHTDSCASQDNRRLDDLPP